MTVTIATVEREDMSVEIHDASAMRARLEHRVVETCDGAGQAEGHRAHVPDLHVVRIAEKPIGEVGECSPRIRIGDGVGYGCQELVQHGVETAHSPQGFDPSAAGVAFAREEGLYTRRGRDLVSNGAAEGAGALERHH